MKESTQPNREEIELPQLDDYRALFLDDTPMLDVRAPVEYEQGAFPHTVNIPLMNDAEREAVGICYKQEGQEAAIELGHERVAGEIKAARVEQWAEFFRQHPDGVLYCFRGGMRSKITQQWIYEQTGTIYPRIKGGYKAMRRFLIDELEQAITTIRPIVLGGQTGSGKTRFLQDVQLKIDLEGIYHHRGSVFGKRVLPQPSQIDIENRLAIAMMRQQAAGHNSLLFEDESANIGSRNLPKPLYIKMQDAPIVMLETPLERRIDITLQEYVVDDLAEHQQYYGEEEGFRRWAEQLQGSLDKIQRRLGGVRHRHLRALMDQAINEHERDNLDAHRGWIHDLLVDYYDPMYDFQLAKKQSRVVFRGDWDEARDCLLQQFQIR